MNFGGGFGYDIHGPQYIFCLLFNKKMEKVAGMLFSNSTYT